MRLYSILFLIVTIAIPSWSQTSKSDLIMSNNKKEIQQQIATTFQDIAKLLAEKNLDVAALPPSFLKIFEAAQTVVAQNGTAVAAGYPDEIEQHPFATAVQNWKENITIKLKAYKLSHAKVKFDTKAFAQSITKSKINLPFNNAMHSEWTKLIANLPNETTGEVLFEALINNTGSTWSLASDFEGLKKHYNQNKKVYRSYSDDGEHFEEKTLPRTRIFDLAIEASVDHKDIPATREKRQNLFQKKIDSWYMIENLAFSAIGSDSLSTLISCGCLDVKSSEVTYKVIPESIKITLLTNIKDFFQKQIGAKSDSAPWHDAASYGASPLSSFHNKYYSNNEWEKYTLKEIQEIEFPTNIARWMWNCNKPAANNKTDITLKLKLVFKKLLKLALSFTKKYGPSFKFNIDDLIFKMKNQLKITNKINIDDLIDIESIYKNVDNRIITTQEFYNKLKVAIDNSITDNSIDIYYTTVINQNISDTTNYDFVFKKLQEIEIELIKELTILIEEKNKSKKKPIPGYRRNTKLRSIDVSLAPACNWNSNFELDLVIQDRGNYYMIIIKKIAPHGFGSTNLDSSSFDFEPIKWFKVDKKGSVTSQKVQLALTYKHTQALVAVNLSTDAVRQTVMRALIGAKLKTPISELKSELETSIITTDPSFINGTMQTPTPITMTNYYTFDLNCSYNPSKKEFEIYGDNPHVCDLEGKYSKRTMFAPGESISFKKDITRIKL